jgi:hypothetical protein
VTLWRSGNFIDLGDFGAGRQIQLPNVALGWHDNPYIAYTSSPSTQSVAFSDHGEHKEGGKPIVVKKDHDGWSELGTIAADKVTDLNIVVDTSGKHDGKPIIAFVDKEIDRGVAMVYERGTWTGIGGPFSIGLISSISLSIGTDGQPFVSFSDHERDNRLSVAQWSGTMWIPLGGRTVSDGAVGYQALAVGHDNVPFVAYTDEAQGHQAYVQVFEDEVWTLLGAVSTGVAYHISLVLDASNTPYVAYRDGTASDGATVVTYERDHREWKSVGQPGFSLGRASYLSVHIGPNNLPYVVYMDTAVGRHMPAITQWSGTMWTALSSVSQLGEVHFPSVASGRGQGPYIVFQNTKKGYSTGTAMSMPSLTTDHRAQFCSGCDAGRFSASPVVDCTDCVPGRYADLRETVKCTLCSPGMYQDRNGREDCLDCALGKKSQEEGTVHCPNCAAGRFTPEVAMTVCFPCLVGKYTPEGSPTPNCPLCDEGQADHDFDASTACLKCMIGQYAEPGGTKCSVHWNYFKPHDNPRMPGYMEPLPVGTHQQLFTARDAVGHTDACNWTVTVVDDEPPSLPACADINVSTSAGSAVHVVKTPLDLIPGHTSIIIAKQDADSIVVVTTSPRTRQVFRAIPHSALGHFKSPEPLILGVAPSLQPAGASACAQRCLDLAACGYFRLSVKTGSCHTDACTGGECTIRDENPQLILRYAKLTDAEVLVIATEDHESTENKASFDHLTPRQTYQIAVETDASIASLGTKKVTVHRTEPIHFVASPDAPMVIAAISLPRDRVKVKFSIPVGNGGANITHYTVRSIDQTVTRIVAASPAILGMHDGLVHRQTYRFSVAAHTSYGVGPWAGFSESVTVASKPGRPEIESSKLSRIAGRVQVVMVPPDDDGGMTITQLTAVSDPMHIIESSPSVAKPIVFSHLLVGYTYSFMVATKNAVGISDLSLPSSSGIVVCRNYYDDFYGPNKCLVEMLYERTGFTCETSFCVDCAYAGYCDLACGICDIHVAVKANVSSATDLTRQLSAQGANEADGEAMRELVAAHLGINQPSDIITDVSFDNTSHSLEFTTSRLAREALQVILATQSGMTDITLNCLRGCPDNPIPLPSAPTTVEFHAVGHGVELTFGPPLLPKDPTGLVYIVRSVPPAFVINTSATSIMAPALTIGQQYLFSVTTTSGDAEGYTGYSDPYVPTRVPSAPFFLPGIKAHDGKLTVRLTPPNDIGGLPLSSFTVAAHHVDGLLPTVITSEPPTTVDGVRMMQVHGLHNGYKYYLTAVATNARGASNRTTSLEHAIALMTCTEHGKWFCDNTGDPSVLLMNPPYGAVVDGTQLPIGRHSMVLTLTDAAANTASCAINVTVEDVRKSFLTFVSILQSPIVPNSTIGADFCCPCRWSHQFYSDVQAIQLKPIQ